MGVSTSGQNLILFVIRYRRENIWVLQLNIVDSEKNIIVYYALRGLDFSRRVWCEQYETRLKSNFDRLLIIFFITQIHRVRFVSLNGEASRVKPSKKNFEKKILEKKLEKKVLGKKCWKKNFVKINSKTKIFITKLYSNIDKCHTIFA